MKRKFYITVSAFSLAALVGTAGASDFENLSVFATFVATLVWTALFVGFGMLAIKTPVKKKRSAPSTAMHRTDPNKNVSTLFYPEKGGLSMIDTNLYEALNAVTDKLSTLIEKNEWSLEIESNKYPIIFRFRKGVGAFSVPWNQETTPQIEFCFRNVTYVSCVPEQYKVDEKFLNKLKNLCKEICRLYLLVQFSRKDTRFNAAFDEWWTTCEGDRVGLLKGTYQP